MNGGARRPTLLSRRRFLAWAPLAAGWLAGCRASNDEAEPSIPNGTVGASGGSDAAGASTAAGGANGQPTTTATVAPVPAPDEQGLDADPFLLGVASGDPLADAVILWTRLCLDPTALDGGLAALDGIDAAVAWDVAEDEGFTRVIASATAVAAAADGHSVHVDATGLPADAELFYRFRLGPWTSRVGRTRTAPRNDGRPARLVVAVAACQHFEHGTFVAHRHLAEERADVVLFLGDFIYEGAAVGGGVRQHPTDEAIDLATYRQRYAWYRRDADLQAAQASAPWIVVWDDHEVQNNYAADRSGGGSASAEFAARRAAAQRAWWENQPVRLPPPGEAGLEIHRELAWGRLARLVMLDGRSHRSPQVCGGAVGNACPELDDTTRTMLGEAQEGWLAQRFAAAAADQVTWTVLGNQTALSDLTVPIGATPVTLFDQWDGYPHARRRLLDAARSAGVTNLVALTGDLHCSIAADLELDGVVHGSEIVASSIASMFAPGGGALFELGLSLLDQVKLIDTRRRGYVRAEFDAAQATFAFRHVSDALDPAATVSTTSTWRITNGRPGVRS